MNVVKHATWASTGCAVEGSALELQDSVGSGVCCPAGLENHGFDCDCQITSSRLDFTVTSDRIGLNVWRPGLLS